MVEALVVVTILYPKAKDGYRNVNLRALINAIKCHGKENKTGFWIFSPKNTDK